MSCSPPRDASQNPAGPTQRFEHVTHPSLYFTSCSATLCSRTCLVIHLSVITGALASCLLVLGCEYALSWSRTTRSILRHRRTLATSVSCAWLAECFSLLCRDYKAINYKTPTVRVVLTARTCGLPSTVHLQTLTHAVALFVLLSTLSVPHHKQPSLFTLRCCHCASCLARSVEADHATRHI